MKAPIHEIAAEGFKTADLYERGRPDYPADAVEFLSRKAGIVPGNTIVDLGAGTGKLTRLIAGTGARLIAIEPVESMRRKFSELLPGVPIQSGTAEEIPLGDRTADAVVVGQAFHWFDGGKALSEIFRVLKPTGKLGLIWNIWDRSVPWTTELADLITQYEKGAPRYRSGEWRKAFATTSYFSPLAEHQFRHIQRCTMDGVLDRVASISFISILGSAAKNHLMDEVKKLLASHFEMKDSEEIDLRYQTDVFVYSRR